MKTWKIKKRRLMTCFMVLCLILSIFPCNNHSSDSVVLAKEDSNAPMAITDIVAPFVWNIGETSLDESLLPDEVENVSFLTITGTIPASDINLYKELQSAEIIGNYQVSTCELLTLNDFLDATGFNNENNFVKAGIRLTNDEGDIRFVGLCYMEYTDSSYVITDEDLYIKDACSPYLAGKTPVLNFSGTSSLTLSSYLTYTKENMKKLLEDIEFEFSSAVTDYKISYEFCVPDSSILPSTIFRQLIGTITLYGDNNLRKDCDIYYEHDANAQYSPLQITAVSGSGFKHWETRQNTLYLYGSAENDDVDMEALCSSLNPEFADESTSFHITENNVLAVTGSDGTTNNISICYCKSVTYSNEEITSVTFRRLTSPYVSSFSAYDSIKLTGFLPDTEDTIEKILSSLRVYHSNSASPASHEIFLPDTDEYQENCNDTTAIALLKIMDEEENSQFYQLYYRQDNANRYGNFKIKNISGENINSAFTFESSPYWRCTLELRGTLPATDENIASILDDISLEFGREDVTWHTEKKEDGYYIYAETADGMNRYYQVNYEVEAPLLTPVPTLVPTPSATPDIPSNALVLEPDTLITKHSGTVKFSEQSDYPKNFNISDYKELRVHYEMYSDASVTDSSTIMKDLYYSTVAYSKIALNNTNTTTLDSKTGKSIYNHGFGKGLIFYYFHQLGTGSGEVRFNLTNLTETPDCISLQIALESEDNIARAVRIKRLIFIPNDAPSASPTPKADSITTAHASSSGSVSSVSPSPTPSQTPAPNLTVSGLSAEIKKPNQCRLTWNSNTHADSYEIYRSSQKDGGWSLYKKVSAPAHTCLDKAVTKTTTRYYKIRAVRTRDKKTQKGTFSEPVKKTIRPLKTPSISVKKKKNKNFKYLKIKLEKYEGTHLDVYVRTKKKYNKLILDTNRIKSYKKGLNIRYLSKGKTYRIRIRTWKKYQGKKIYSSYSNIVKIRT